MDRYLTAYVDLPFLQRFVASKPEDAASDWIDVWKGVYNFIREHAQVVACFAKSELDPTLQRFLFDYNSYIRFEPEAPHRGGPEADLRRIADDHPRTVFFMEDPEVPVEEMRQSTGLLFARLDDLERLWPQLFDVHEIPVNTEREPPFRWELLTDHAQPLNAVVIADKYVYEEIKKDIFDQNTGRLISALLPEAALVVPVHVTIVTNLEKLFEATEISPQQVYDQICSFLEEVRPDLDFHLTVLGYRETSHKDRFVVTNYGELSSNDSFAFFENGELKKDTKIIHLPSSSHGESTSRQLARIASLSQDPPCVFNFRSEESGATVLLAAGDNINRLLDYAEESS